MDHDDEARRLDFNERAEIARLVADLGTRGAARLLGVDRHLLPRAIADLELQKGSNALLRVRLTRLALPRCA